MDFLKYRYVFLVLSLVIIISGLTYGYITGYKFDIDFKGGTNIQVDLNESFDNKEVEEIVKNITGVNPLVQKISGGVDMVSITTDTLSNDKVDEILSQLSSKYTNIGDPYTKNVQPSFGKELVKSAINATIISIVIILIYILIRFRTLGAVAAFTAILGLVHDVLIIVAIYAFLKLPINAAFVGVILTIIGYSINDTIIIYDRIRENKRKAVKNSDLKDTINSSLNQTLRRTVFTSITTVVSILIVYIFAYVYHQTVLEEFALPLTIGIISGTYSSIFVASSLWYVVENLFSKKSEAKNK